MKLINVIKSESYKILIKRKALLFIILVTMINGIAFYSEVESKVLTFENSKAQQIYEEEISKLSGPYSLEKELYIDEMYQKYHRVSNQIENFNTKPEDYKRLIREYPNAEEYDSVFQIFLHLLGYCNYKL